MVMYHLFANLQPKQLLLLPENGKRMYFKFPDVRYQLANKDRNSIFAEKRQKRVDQVF
jgi:hypothetical protein